VCTQVSLADVLACREVCRDWKQRLGSSFCSTIRIPHSLWHEAASSPRLAETVTTAASAYPQASRVLLDAGGSRPGLPANIWPTLLQSLKPWFNSGPPSSVSCSGCSTISANANGSSKSPQQPRWESRKGIMLHLQAPPSPMRLHALQAGLPQLTHILIQHTSQSLYSRHLAALATCSQLQSLVLVLMHPRMDLRSLTHQVCSPATAVRRSSAGMGQFTIHGSVAADTPRAACGNSANSFSSISSC